MSQTVVGHWLSCQAAGETRDGADKPCTRPGRRARRAASLCFQRRDRSSRSRNASGWGPDLISGYTGEHPQRGIEAIAVAPYPIAGDIRVAGVWRSDSPHAVTVVDQAYDFEAGELTNHFEFEAGGCKARVEVLVFCSLEEPRLVCQEHQGRG